MGADAGPKASVEIANYGIRPRARTAKRRKSVPPVSTPFGGRIAPSVAQAFLPVRSSCGSCREGGGVKRLIGILLTIALLTGVPFTTELFGGRVPVAQAPAGAANYIAAWIANIQMNGFPLPEPVSIMLLSLILLGGTTLLRRHRTNRRA